jgi:murein DD-endopeptidase MepM/ murein hydrolase activator NlpD
MDPMIPTDGALPPSKPDHSRWWAMRVGGLAPRWSLWGLLAALVVVAGGAFLAANGHGRVRPVAVTPAAGRQHGGSRARPVAAPTAAPLAMPVAGNPEAGFGWVYSSYLGEWYYNPGVSIAAATGTPVHAAWGGTVSFVGQEPYMGLTVKVNDGNGYTTVYGHLGSASVRPGQTVSQGTTVGTVGGQSLYSRQGGAHVDFQVYHDGQPVNPESFIKGSS